MHQDSSPGCDRAVFPGPTSTAQGSMSRTLESVKGDGGSIRIGSTGTIGSLMTQELESMKHATTTCTPPRRKSQTTSISVPCGGSMSKVVQPKRCLPNEASSSCSTGASVSCSTNGVRSTVNGQKMKSNLGKNVHSIPILSSEGTITPAERTPRRQKPEKRGTNVAKVVDLKCGHPDKAWSGPITSRLKKLGFAKLSQTIS